MIEALFRKISYPDIRGYIKIKSIWAKEEGIILKISILVLNVSAVQNEENVAYRLICSSGVFCKYKKRYTKGGDEFVNQNNIKLLFYGQPEVHEELIWVDYSELHEKQDKLKLLLAFGGRKSPLKQSTYDLNFEEYMINNQINVERLIQGKNENVLFSENEETSIEHRIDCILRGL